MGAGRKKRTQSDNWEAEGLEEGTRKLILASTWWVARPRDLASCSVPPALPRGSPPHSAIREAGGGQRPPLKPSCLPGSSLPRTRTGHRALRTACHAHTCAVRQMGLQTPAEPHLRTLPAVDRHTRRACQAGPAFVLLFSLKETDFRGNGVWAPRPRQAHSTADVLAGVGHLDSTRRDGPASATPGQISVPDGTRDPTATRSTPSPIRPVTR